MKPLISPQSPIPIHPKYICTAYFLHTYGRELKVPKEFVDQCIIYLQQIWEKIQDKRSYPKIALALIYLESRRTKFHISVKDMAAILQQIYPALKAIHIIYTATELRQYLHLEKSIISLQDYMDQLFRKIQASPSFFVLVEEHSVWVDQPVKQLIFYSTQITEFLLVKKDRPIIRTNLAGAVLFGANYLLGQSFGQKRAYLNQTDLTKILDLIYYTVIYIYHTNIVPMLTSKKFKRVLKQWED